MKQKISKGQIYALNKLINSLIKDEDRELRLYVISKILGRDIDSTKNLTFDDWELIRDRAYDDWWNNNWEPTESFKDTVSFWEDKYLKEVKGYQKLNI